MNRREGSTIEWRKLWIDERHGDCLELRVWMRLLDRRRREDFEYVEGRRWAGLRIVKKMVFVEGS